jgi:uncharacterized protein (DUF2252 family)
MPFEFDLKRLIVSFVLAGGQSRMRKKTARQLAEKILREYCERVHLLARAGDIVAFRSRVDLAGEITKIKGTSTRKIATKWLDGIFLKGKRDDGLIGLSQDRPRFLDRPPLLFHLDDDSEWQHSAWKAFEKYRSGLGGDRGVLPDGYELSDLAFRVAGIGSVGLTRILGLLVNPDQSPLILELRQAVPPAFGDNTGASGGDAARIVRGQPVIQSVPDRFLAPVVLPDEPEFYVRRLSGGRLDLMYLSVGDDWLPFLARLRARTLANAHARSGAAGALASYLDDVDAFASAISGFAIEYSARVKADWGRFLTAIRTDSVNQPMPQPA